MLSLIWHLLLRINWDNLFQLYEPQCHSLHTRRKHDLPERIMRIKYDKCENILCNSGSQSVAPGQAALALPRNLLECKFSGSVNWIRDCGWSSLICVLTSPQLTLRHAKVWEMLLYSNWLIDAQNNRTLSLWVWIVAGSTKYGIPTIRDGQACWNQGAECEIAK